MRRQEGHLPSLTRHEEAGRTFTTFNREEAGRTFTTFNREEGGRKDIYHI